MVESIKSHQPSAENPPAQAASNPDPAQAASELLDVGDRRGDDDFPARVRAFGDVIQQGDSEYQQALVAEILRQDPNAFNSWMSPTLINAQVDAGTVSPTARDAMAAAIAAAYNDGQIPSEEITNDHGEVIGTSSALDTYLQNSYPNYLTTAYLDNQVENARNLREFSDFFAGPHYSSEVSEFRDNYSTHLINDYVINDRGEDAGLRDRAAVLASIVLNGDPTSGQIAANVLNRLDQGQIQMFMEAVSRGGELYTQNFLEYPTQTSIIGQTEHLEASEISLPDQFSAMLAQIARTDSSEAREVASMLARLPASSGDIFNDGRTDNAQEHIDAMGQLFVSHAQPILDSFTDFDTTKIGSTDDSDLKQYMRDASDLGTLFNILLFNSDQSFQDQARAEVLDYAAELKSQINTTEGNAEAMGRLSMLMGAADDAITQGFNELKAREDGRFKFISFILDLTLAGTSIGKRTNDALVGLFGNIFSDDRVTDILKDFSGSIIDSTTGYLTEEAKEMLADSLGEDEAELLDQQSASNILREALLSGIDNQRDLASIINFAEDVSQGINIWRK